MKLLAIYIARVVLKVFYLFPVKQNRIYFSSDRGNTMRCNPMYIYKYMQNNSQSDYEYIWGYIKNIDIKYSNTIIVKPKSLKNIYYILTSKIIISNSGLGAYIPKRRNQCFINTWHGGGAYKKVGVESAATIPDAERKVNVICAKQTNVFLSSSKKFTEVMSQSKLMPLKRFWECGMPRNDRLIQGDKSAAVKVKKYYHIYADKKLILFAPTYRGAEGDGYCDVEIAIERCLQAAQERFGGEWIFLMRKHLFVEKINQNNCINTSDYPDMQELLLAVDIFITDYSSTIWDYSLLNKPGFLYTPDIDTYKKEVSFYTDPDTWAFPLAKTNDELIELIAQFDELSNSEKIKRHHDLLGNKESGKSTELLVNYIKKKCGGK